MMKEISLETLPSVNKRDPSHDKNLPIKRVYIKIYLDIHKAQDEDKQCHFGGAIVVLEVPLLLSGNSQEL